MLFAEMSIPFDFEMLEGTDHFQFFSILLELVQCKKMIFYLINKPTYILMDG